MMREQEEEEADLLTILKSHGPDQKKPLSQVRKEFSDFYREFQGDTEADLRPVPINDRLTGYWIHVPESSPDRVILFFHGGGFSLGSTMDHLGLCARIAEAARSPVFSVDYRLAPENPFPAQVDDAIAAYRYLLEKKIPSHRIIPLGISAGGTLVLDLLLTARDQKMFMPPAAVCLSPAVDMFFLGESVKTNTGLDWITQARLDGIRLTWLGSRDPKNPLASPVHAQLGGLPRLYVQAGTHELLLSDIASFVQKARWAGVPVRFELWEGMFHCWQVFARDVPEGREAIGHIGAFVQDILGR